MITEPPQQEVSLHFRGGYFGILLPFLFFLVGTVALALSGAPDERGFWPVLIGAIALGLLLAKDRNQYAEVLLQGMSQKIVMVMITAWMLASTIGILMRETGLVEALVWLSMQLHLGPAGFLLAAFLICCVISMSTGSSFATILICSPLLYPSGGLMGVQLPLLAGAILAGATFGDFSAPISDTTLASTLSQQARIGAAVRSRLRYALPVVGVAGLAFVGLQMARPAQGTLSPQLMQGDPAGLPMLGVPVLIIFLFLRGKHLVPGLMAGLFAGMGIGLAFGLLSFSDILALDRDNFRATSFIIEGINRAVGISFFTILLLGLVHTIKASGILAALVKYAAQKANTPRAARHWIAGVSSLAVLLTTHSIVAILMVGDFVSETGKQANIPGVQRANLMSLVACIFPFVLPYFIPVILMANMTQTGVEYGLSPQTPLEVGLYNLVAWGLLGCLIFMLLRREDRRETKDRSPAYRQAGELAERQKTIDTCTAWRDNDSPTIDLKNMSEAKKLEDGQFELYDLSIEVESIDGNCTCAMTVGDKFYLKGGKLSMPNDQDFCVYALQSCLPLLPAKQRKNHPADWMETDARIICPDPACKLIMRIDREAARVLNHDDVSPIEWKGVKE